MTLFTWLYNRYFPIQLKLMTRLGDIENKKSAKLISHTIINYIGAHMIYIVNVMTNQGKLSIFLQVIKMTMHDYLPFQVAKKGLSDTLFGFLVAFGFWEQWSWSILILALLSHHLQYQRLSLL